MPDARDSYVSSWWLDHGYANLMLELAQQSEALTLTTLAS